MNRESITIQYCLDMYDMKNYATIINDGQVIDFVSEKEKIKRTGGTSNE